MASNESGRPRTKGPLSSPITQPQSLSHPILRKGAYCLQLLRTRTVPFPHPALKTPAWHPPFLGYSTDDHRLGKASSGRKSSLPRRAGSTDAHATPFIIRSPSIGCPCWHSAGKGVMARMAPIDRHPFPPPPAHTRRPAPAAPAVLTAQSGPAPLRRVPGGGVSASTRHAPSRAPFLSNVWGRRLPLPVRATAPPTEVVVRRQSLRITCAAWAPHGVHGA